MSWHETPWRLEDTNSTTTPSQSRDTTFSFQDILELISEGSTVTKRTHETFYAHETNFFSAFCILGSVNLPVVTVYLESGVSRLEYREIIESQTIATILHPCKKFSVRHAYHSELSYCTLCSFEVKAACTSGHSNSKQSQFKRLTPYIKGLTAELYTWITR